MKSNTNNSKVWLPLALSVMLAVGMVLGYVMNEKAEAPFLKKMELQQGVAPIGQVEELIRFVENKYVDSVDRKVLVKESLNAILNKLDPHSVYIPKENLDKIDQELNGSFHGLGLESYYIDDTVNIMKVLNDSPAQKGGLKVFDKILRINGENVAGQGLLFETIQDKIQSKKGEFVTLKVLDVNGQERLVELVVEEIPLNSLDVATKITPNVGYIKLSRFSSNTYKEFMDEVEKLHDDKVQDLIIDLRGNPGGYLPQAVNILSQLFPVKGNLLVYTVGRDGKKNEYKSTGKPFFNVDKVVVLIDELSASASEILAGAVQDWDRGIVIGRRSFGKGLVQEQYPLSSGDAIRLTVARYYTPTGRSIQRNYDNLDYYENDLSDRIDRGALYHRDERLKDTIAYPRYKTLRMNRTVIGGGGISPDVFIPIDSAELDVAYLTALDSLPNMVFEKMKNIGIKSMDGNHKVQLIDNILRELNIKSNRVKQLLTKDIEHEISILSGNTSDYKSIIHDPFVEEGLRYINGDSKL